MYLVSLYITQSLSGITLLLHSQVQLAKDKLDSSRLENLTDSEETIAEMARRHDRDRLILFEENKKLLMEVDEVMD